MYNEKAYKVIYGYFRERHGLRDYRRGWLKGTCPECGKTDKFGINIEKDRGNCFSCGFKGSVFQVIMQVEGLDTFRAVWDHLKVYKDLEYRLPRLEKVDTITPTLPDSFKLLNQGTSTLAKSARQYWRKRGFKVDYLSAKGLGYCTTGEYLGYSIIPFYYLNTLVYFKARQFIKSGPRYNNPPTERFGIGKSTIIYNMEALFLYDEIYGLEGEVNALTLGDKAIALGGKAISAWQISAIIKSPCSSFTIILDPDAIPEAIDNAFKLIDFKNVKIVVLPDDKDPNDLGKNQTLEYANKTHFLKYRDLLKFKHESPELIKENLKTHLGL